MTLPISIKKELPSNELAALQQQLITVLEKIEIPEKECQFVVNEVFKYYNEPHRTYHNLSHLQSLFKVSALTNQSLKNPTVFQLAIIFHDIIYEIGKKDNEVKSAALAVELLDGHLSKEDSVLLTEIIESTAKHEPQVDHPDLLLFLDCDLSVLAAPNAVYKDYAKAIRQEYIKYPTILYRPGRRKVLQHFLKKERIYFTDFFFENYESQARANLSSELQSLKSLFS